jgi:hypothetical protein
MGGQFLLAVWSGVFSLVLNPFETIFALIFQPLIAVRFLPLLLSYLGVYP